MKIACWNMEWRRPNSWQSEVMCRQVESRQPDIVCLPEAYETTLAGNWHGVFSEADYGYPLIPGRRKVTLWSKTPWSNVDQVGSRELPPGRFVSAQTRSQIGGIQIVAVCVPWSAAHVSTGRRDRSPWEDHLLYLERLAPLLSSMVNSMPTILIGDLNQRIPRSRSPFRAYEALQSALDGFAIWTSGEIEGLEIQPVCHIAGTRQLRCQCVSGYSRQMGTKHLSDHDGLIVDVSMCEGSSS